MKNNNIILDIHSIYGFYQSNENGVKCEFMDLENEHMLCNKDFGMFKKNEIYIIDSNSNDEVFYDNSTTENVFEKYNSLERIPVERFQDSTFTLLKKENIKMKTIESNFIVRGVKGGNTYYIVKRNDGNYNIYQAFCELNKHMVDKPLKDIKKALDHLKKVDDEEILVSIPNEEYPCFLFLFNKDILEMNGFRITLDSEEIL